MTVLEHLISAFQKSAIYNRHDLARPNVVLWTDGERLWEKVAPTIAQARPGFFQLDPSGISEFRGPSTWIRYQLGKWSGEEIPVVYLPGIFRHQFRGAAGFPDEARHLYALQFQGEFCGQVNGKDWTPMALLGSGDAGLGLDLAKDKATQQALQDQLTAVLQTPEDSLRGRRLEASDFHDLAAGDPVLMMLQWMGEPNAAAWPAEQKAAFAAIGKKEFGIDTAKDGLISAAEKLAAGEGKWAKVWSRFAEAPASYRGVVQALEMVQPDNLFENANPHLPANNRKQEDALRAALLDAGKLPANKACERLAALASEHAERADSVWASLGDASLAIAARHLGKMAAALESGLPGTTCEALGDAYLAKGWIVDLEARLAWAAVRRAEDVAAVTSALRAAYLPWIESLATRLQDMPYPVPTPKQAKTLVPEPGVVVLFVDGFRSDLAKELVQRLSSRKFQVNEEPSWSPLPTVTATAKPGWNPLSGSLNGDHPSEHFEPTVVASGKPCTTTEFRKLLAHHGWTWIDPAQAGDPGQAGWTETASFDSLGHTQGAKLAWHINDELAGVAERVDALFQAGWKLIHIVTDHGWLWMPDGLPKIDLPKHLTVSKWGRCARPDPKANHSLPQVPWFWANEYPIVLAPGIGVFQQGTEYTHGGLTLQEALTLSLTIMPPVGAEQAVAIKAVKWVGLRAHVQLSSNESDLRVDIRSKAADAGSSFLSKTQQTKTPSYDGKFAILVEDDSHAGQAAVLVALRGDTVLAKKNITIGEE